MRLRHLHDHLPDGQLRWFEAALQRLRRLRREPDARLRGLFTGDAPLYVARAPGRLDVMGGIADYSGALVLELPLARSTSAILQGQEPPRFDLVTFRGGRPCFFSLDLEPLASGSLRTAEAVARWFAERESDRWAAYVIGLVHACMERAAGGSAPRGGFRLLLDSEVPEGKGVSSSAALEVAAMAVIAAHFRVEMAPEELAAACQWVENRIVGAPCGIMDQMTSACGRKDRLLRLRCQPGSIEGYLAIPAGYRFYGIDSGIRHAVSGADYGTVRTAAFMGYRVIAAAAGLPVRGDGARVRVHDSRWGGYLANLTPTEFEAHYRGLLPERMTGAAFLERYQGITDAVTRVEPDREYPVRHATAYPVYEQERVERFAALLTELPQRPAAAREMGRLMYDSHAGYGACGLGSEGTDRLVQLVARAGPDAGLFGAKITGGGSGGTVAVFGTEAAEAAVHGIADCYARETGRNTEVFVDSGPGAADTGVLVLPAVPA